jgi:hypothetical protein
MVATVEVKWMQLLGLLNEVAMQWNGSSGDERVGSCRLELKSVGLKIAGQLYSSSIFRLVTL